MRTISPQTTPCLYSPFRHFPVKNPSLPATNSLQSLANWFRISPASLFCCGLRPNLTHLPIRAFRLDNHRESRCEATDSCVELWSLEKAASCCLVQLSGVRLKRSKNDFESRRPKDMVDSRTSGVIGSKAGGQCHGSERSQGINKTSYRTLSLVVRVRGGVLPRPRMWGKSQVTVQSRQFLECLECICMNIFINYHTM